MDPGRLQWLTLIAVPLYIGAALLVWGVARWRGSAATRGFGWLFLDELLIVGAVLIPATLGSPALELALALLLARGLYERFELAGRPAGIAGWVTAALAVTLLLLLALHGRASWLVGAGLAVAAAAWAARRAGSRSAAGAALIYPGLAVAGTALLIATPDGPLLLLLTYLAVETNDAVALVVGKLFGRHRPWPRLSPGKSAEGLVAGLLVAAPLAWGFGRAVTGYPAWQLLLIVGVALAAGVAGDLTTSALKRAHGRKDFAPLLVRHGGVLDIYDALLFAAPAVALLVAVLPGVETPSMVP